MPNSEIKVVSWYSPIGLKDSWDSAGFVAKMQRIRRTNEHLFGFSMIYPRNVLADRKVSDSCQF